MVRYKIYVPEICGKLFCLFLVAAILSLAQKAEAPKYQVACIIILKLYDIKFICAKCLAFIKM